MLQRDKFEPEQCVKHFPKATFEEYFLHLAGPYAFRRLFSTSHDFVKQLEFRNNAVATVFFFSLLPVILHKKIYWFRNYTSKKSRILWGLAWILLPSNLLALYFQKNESKELMLKYQFNEDLFQKMLQAGDINICNPYQEWTEI